MIKAFLLYAMQFASQYGDYPMAEMPKVVVLSPVKLADMCGSNAYACYWGLNKTLYFPKECNENLTLECRSAIIHEMVHYLDDMDGGFALGCNVAGEKEAYAVEDVYLKKHGSSLKKMGYTDAFLKLLTWCPAPKVY